MSVALELLHRLFKRAQAAQSRGQSECIKLSLTQAQCSEYFAMRNLADADEFRAQLAVAERKGAIALHLAPRQAAPRDVLAIAVADLSALATHLGLDMRAAQVAQAREQLVAYRDEFPVIDAILEAWGTGKKVRGEAPTVDVRQEVIDAVRVMRARRGKSDEVLMRRESGRLFEDSKRIEKIGRWLDVLYGGDLKPSGFKRREVFSGLGLHKEPQPFLIATDDAVVNGGGVESRLFRPYHGLPMTGIDGFRFEKTPSCLLTVENKETFHELAVRATGTRVCVIYTGGMPSPAWQQVYAKALQALPDGTPVYHFGDLDVGGFRIAHAINQTANMQSRTLLPWLMDPTQLKQRGHTLYEATDSQVDAMRHWCQRIGWKVVADHLISSPGMLEQEVVAPSLPHERSPTCD